MTLDELESAIAFREVMIRHTKKTIERPNTHGEILLMLNRQLEKLELELSDLKAQLPKKTVVSKKRKGNAKGKSNKTKQ